MSINKEKIMEIAHENINKMKTMCGDVDLDFMRRAVESATSVFEVKALSPEERERQLIKIIAKDREARKQANAGSVEYLQAKNYKVIQKMYVHEL